MLRQQVLNDSADEFNKFAKWFIIPIVILYVCFILVQPHIVYPVAEGYQTIARDSGLLMKTIQPFPEYLLSMHWIMAVLLFLLVFFQKLTVYKMLSGWRKKVHSKVGYAILFLIGGMNYAGYKLGDYSSLPNFDWFIIVFAAPWAIWMVSIYITIKLKQIMLHRFLSNMLVKGCIAVPMARIVGSSLQRMGWEEGSGYYTGIGAVSLVISVWLFYDIYKIIRGRY